jgi:hypothetical protein
VTDFMNFKIEPTQSFRCAHRGRLYVRMFIELSDHMCMNICVCTVFFKKSASGGKRVSTQKKKHKMVGKKIPRGVWRRNGQ